MIADGLGSKTFLAMPSIHDWGTGPVAKKKAPKKK